MFGGTIYQNKIDDWNISWESLDNYRFWCHQEHEDNSKNAVVVMLNPGSLSGSGERLNSDVTLRILRELFINTGYNPYIINLFNFAAAAPFLLFEQWELRDHPIFDYLKLPLSNFDAVMYAYGDYENGNNYPVEIKNRVTEIRNLLKNVPEIIVPRNKSGTPKHPMVIQRQKLKEEYHKAIIKHALSNK